MESDGEWRWDRFVKIGQTIHNMRGEVRILQAKTALQLAKHLVESGYHVASKERSDVYDQLLPEIAAYLDADTSTIEAAVERHFLYEHGKAGLDEAKFKIEFFPKRSGVQAGRICYVSNGTTTTRYYIKTHQHGPTPSNIRSQGLPDAKELFIYKLLQLIGVGPEVHFILPTHGTKRTIYIATKDAGLTLLDKLLYSAPSPKPLLQMDLISRILCLRDCTTNTNNCGLVDGRPMIIDFRIETQEGGYKKEDVLQRFYEGNGEYNYTHLMLEAVGAANDTKLDVARQSLQAWNLPANINAAKADVEKIMTDAGDRVMFEGDLDIYVADVKHTVEILKAVLDSA